MKAYEIIAKTDCKFCKKAINLLEIKGYPFVVTVVDKNPAFLEEIKTKWNWQTVPVILESDENNQFKLIGGCAELEQILLKGNDDASSKTD